MDRWRILGNRLHGERLAEGRPQEEGDGFSEAETPSEKDPETLADALESRLRRAGLSIRRARWFRLLAGAALVWGPWGSGGWRLLKFRRGRLTSTDEPPSPAPRPPAAVRRRRCGWRALRGFTLADYDRLRVLTTEMRRLRKASRPMWLFLESGRPLKAAHLDRLLPWV
jgi:hypothetical protein